MASTLLVASAGGHLEELLRLLASFGVPTGRIWVTYGVPQARTKLSGEQVVAAHHPTTKHVPNAIRNYLLARRVFREHRISRVISTGAAVAVPFMVRARQLEIPCHYIESATRVVGPSLAGRMLQRVGGVHLYRQLGAWGEERWVQGPSVFDGFEAVQSGEHFPPRAAVVSLGTHRFPFPTLVDRLSAHAPDGFEMTWQLGSTPPPPGRSGRFEGILPSGQLFDLFRRADVVVGHAGVGLALTALTAGKVPVLVPRRRSRREHTDDHQVQLSRALEEMGLAVTAEADELTFEHLERAAALRVVKGDRPPFHFQD
jgi:UDP-N-acetylglucosamine--N-acetylmuramyl-(pentapeptide) pyrophosphoryl-undecaprenol N-acetylglucosamine transferase